MTDVLIGVIVMLTAYAVGVTCLAWFAYREWGVAEADAAEQRLLFNTYLKHDAMARHPAGKALPSIRLLPDEEA